ncbi:hypothetical protein CYMTET_54102 [Cymbomonas tetramitiformis]|uniref:Hemimethylated DNA-binding domain-containing protein n=1 Tax=Cymbomonas tetramitiformis TaxID=36881 RepID=A0AAE0BFQ8_9CHLO|nr:hypothetical protein CYMTET_54102 [Cymbomonas tetramitiformis]
MNLTDLQDDLPRILSHLDARSLVQVGLTCRFLGFYAWSDALWQRLCEQEHWRLRTCHMNGEVQTWRQLYARFSLLSPEQRWDVEWEGGGFGKIPPCDHFAGSQQPRINKPADVKFSIGQVFSNVGEPPYRGVVVGWDEITKVPTGWPSLSKNRQPWLSKPHYSVLVHGDGSSRYIVDDNMRLEANPKPIDHPSVDEYFTHFDGQHYCPAEELQAIYPEDILTR